MSWKNNPLETSGIAPVEKKRTTHRLKTNNLFGFAGLLRSAALSAIAVGPGPEVFSGSFFDGRCRAFCTGFVLGRQVSRILGSGGVDCVFVSLVSKADHSFEPSSLDDHWKVDPSVTIAGMCLACTNNRKTFPFFLIIHYLHQNWPSWSFFGLFGPKKKWIQMNWRTTTAPRPLWRHAPCQASHLGRRSVSFFCGRRSSLRQNSTCCNTPLNNNCQLALLKTDPGVEHLAGSISVSPWMLPYSLKFYCICKGERPLSRSNRLKTTGWGTHLCQPTELLEGPPAKEK